MVIFFIEYYLSCIYWILACILISSPNNIPPASSTSGEWMLKSLRSISPLISNPARSLPKPSLACPPNKTSSTIGLVIPFKVKSPFSS